MKKKNKVSEHLIEKQNKVSKISKPKKVKFELASQDKVEELQPYIDKVLKALGHSGALVTDESYISDFLPFLGSMGREEAFVKFSKKMDKMGVKVYFIDSIIDVAERLKNERNK